MSVPREPSSAGLSDVGTCRHCSGEDASWISVTLFAMKGLNFLRQNCKLDRGQLKLPLRGESVFAMILAIVQAHLCDFGESFGGGAAIARRPRASDPTRKLHLSEQKKRFKDKGNTVVTHYITGMLE